MQHTMYHAFKRISFGLVVHEVCSLFFILFFVCVLSVASVNDKVMKWHNFRFIFYTSLSNRFAEKLYTDDEWQVIDTDRKKTISEWWKV